MSLPTRPVLPRRKSLRRAAASALALALTLGLGLPAQRTEAARPADNAMVSCSANPCAARVYGQPDFTTHAPNAVDAGTLNLPQAEALDGNGGLYVVDSADNRVLYYPSSCVSVQYDCAATRVYGQTSFSSNGGNTGGATQFTLNDPQGVAVDPSSGGIYVADQYNHRVLYYPVTCSSTPFACGATRVYGQADFVSTGVRTSTIHYPNSVAVDSSGGLYVASQSDNRVLHFPSGSTTADRAYGQPGLTTTTANNGGVSATSLHGPEGAAVDSNGGLYIADAFNNRVLHFANTCAVSGCPADIVYGQTSAMSNTVPGYFDSPSASSLNISTGNPVGLAPDSAGGLYVADTLNNRVLHYSAGCPAAACAADQVYGQTDFSSKAAGATATGLASPYGVVVDGSGNLTVADGGNNRMLYYPMYSSGGTGCTVMDAACTTATQVYGQSDYNSSTPSRVLSTSLDGPGGANFIAGTALDVSGGLYLADTVNNRVLYYPAGCSSTPFACPATRVYGQFDSSNRPDFSSNSYSSSVASATNLWQPEGVAVDPISSDLYIADSQNDRVLHYPANSTTADRAYGQPDLTTGFATNQGCYQPKDITTALCLPEGVAVDGNGGLYVADASHNRVLYYSGACATSGCTADRVYGQTSLNSTSSGNGATGLNLPTAVSLDAAGGLYVADTLNLRVIYFPAGSTTPDQRVWGQASLTSYYNAPASAGTLKNPAGVVADSSDGLYIADSGNNRALFFPPAPTVTINGLTFTTQSNGCTGPVIPIYGSSAAKTFLLQVAVDYCNSYAAAHGGSKTGGPDVEYLSNGDSCPGVAWVGTATTANANGNNDLLGASDAYAGTCKADGFATGSVTLGDNKIAGLASVAIAQCPGATVVQGGTFNAGSYTQCLGGFNSQGAAACSYTNLTFPGADNLSDAQASLLWAGGSSDWGPFSGCSGVTPGNLNRTLGSGTRATYCNNIDGSFNDTCASGGVGTIVDAPTTGDMLADVCGIPSGKTLKILNDPTNAGSGSANVTGPLAPRLGTNQTAGEGFIGYSIRSGILDPYASDAVTPLAGCGIVGLNGQTSWNGTCNPNTVTTGTGLTNPGSGKGICAGDEQVSLGSYTAWGYEHLFTSPNFTNPDVPAFLTFLRSNAEQTQLYNYGFLRDCQLNQVRNVDGGPYSAGGATC